MTEDLEHKAHLLLIIIFLTAISFWFILEGAVNEPYLEIRSYDILTQVGVGFALVTLWIIYSSWLVLLIIKRKLSTIWVLAIIWMLIVQFYLIDCPFGYLRDMANFHGIK